MQSVQAIQPVSPSKELEAGKGALAPEVGFGGIIGKSVAIQCQIEKAWRYARCEATVLITGETGTGKEVFARAIHHGGSRSSRPFVALNCAALPNDLVENELFGHCLGAFTGAGRSHPGLIAQAESGTLFLDEIQSLPATTQAKLLRFLQEGEYRPLGGDRSHRADARVIVASNLDLAALTCSGGFRPDLYFRLCVLTLNLPSLRQRREDIPLLANHLIEWHRTVLGRGPASFSPSAMQRLVEHTWPGNIRELKNVIQRALVASTGPVIEAEHLDLPVPLVLGYVLSFREQKARAVKEFERKYLKETLAVSGGNVTRAAKAAGTDRRSFIRLLRKHKLTVQAVSASNCRPASGERLGPAPG